MFTNDNTKMNDCNNVPTRAYLAGKGTYNHSTEDMSLEARVQAVVENGALSLNDRVTALRDILTPLLFHSADADISKFAACG